MISEDIQQRGENLWNALDLTAAAWQETNAMLDELSALMHKQLPQALRLTLQQGKEQYDFADPGGYIYSVRLVQWGLVPRQRQNPVGWLYASAAIGSRDGASLLVGKTPSLTVGYGFGETGWDNILRADDLTTGRDGEPWEGVDVRADGRLILLDGYPWQYAKKESQWHFCLPLFVLNTVRDLREYVVTPVVSLLQGEEPEVALGSHPHAFRFQVVEERLELAEAPQSSALSG